MFYKITDTVCIIISRLSGNSKLHSEVQDETKALLHSVQSDNSSAEDKLNAGLCFHNTVYCRIIY